MKSQATTTALTRITKDTAQAGAKLSAPGEFVQSRVQILREILPHDTKYYGKRFERPLLVSRGLAPDTASAGWHQDPNLSSHGQPGNENLSAVVIHLVERPDFGTQWWTWLYGEFVGEDEFGMRYYRTKGGKIDPTLLFERRWAVYCGVAEASRVPPSWHGWMHHTADVPPTEDVVTPHSWEKPHQPNLTGTPGAHRPSGSTLAQGRRPKATGDYKAWSPGGK